MKNVRLKSKFKIPIYDVTVLIVVADDAVAAWKRYKKFVDDDDEGFRALCCAKGGEYALFFTTAKISADDIGHEVKHLVDYIMEYIGEDEKAKERPAYLTGFLHKRISTVLRKGNIRLNRKRKKVA